VPPKRTGYRFTKGIVNLPLLFDSKGNKIMIEKNGKIKPKVKDGLRYLFWEIDNQDVQLLQEVLLIYRYFECPVYYHRSMRGYHFLSLKELTIKAWSKAIIDLRPTNDMYPPITLRIKANKYKNELNQFRLGDIIGNEDNDLKLTKLKRWIDIQAIGLINMYYYVVTYPMDNNDIDNKLNLEQREKEFLKQIEDSDGHGF